MSGKKQSRKVLRQFRECPHIDCILNLADGRTPEMLRDRALMEHLYATRLKLGALCSLNVDNLDFTDETVIVRNRLGTESLIVPVSNRAMTWLDKYMYFGRDKLLGIGDLGWVFMHVGGEPVTPRWVRTMLRAYTNAKALGSHRLRP